MTPFARRRPLAALLAALPLLAAAPRAGAQAVPSDSLYSGFLATGDYVLEVDGKDQPKAEIYLSEKARALLVMASDFPSPVLIDVPNHNVETLDLMKVAKQPDGSVDLLADAVLAPQGPYEIEGTELSFKVGGKAAKLKQAPWLLGLHSAQELLDHSPDYRRLFHEYQPDPDTMKSLAAWKEPVRVRTFFGSWCPFCKKHVPLLLKVADELKGSKIAFEWFGVPHEFDKDPEAAKNNIQGVPTGIVYVGGKEIGRIPVSDWSSPELGLLLVLQGKAGK